MENKMNLKKLISKLKKDTLTSEETAFLLNLLKESEPGDEINSFYQETWANASGYKFTFDSDKAYKEIIEKLGVVSDKKRSGPAKISSTKTLKVYFRRILQYAAIFIFAFGLSWLVHSVYTKSVKSPDIAQFQKVNVPYGSKSTIELPDGSVVILNSGSALSYANSDFGIEKRIVFLEGEGFFNVKRDSTRPFYVNTRATKIKVLGTTFNVKAYTDEKIEETTLVTGSVEIYAANDQNEKNKPLVLKPNQKAVFVKADNRMQKIEDKPLSAKTEPAKLEQIKLQIGVNTEQSIAWKDNMLVFDNEPFSSLIVEIERWYNVKIIMNYPELNQARFTGKFDKETLEQFLNALVTVTPFKYEIKQNQITISKKTTIKPLIKN